MIPSLPRRNTRRGFYFQKDVGLFDAYYFSQLNILKSFSIKLDLAVSARSKILILDDSKGRLVVFFLFPV